METVIVRRERNFRYTVSSGFVALLLGIWCQSAVVAQNSRLSAPESSLVSTKHSRTEAHYSFKLVGFRITTEGVRGTRRGRLGTIIEPVPPRPRASLGGFPQKTELTGGNVYFRLPGRPGN